MRLSNVIRWIVRRFVTLIPMYYLAIIVSMLTNTWTIDYLGIESEISFWNLLFHAVFLHGFIPRYMNCILLVEWYIGLLAIFYILAPILYRFIDSLEKATILCLLSIAFFPQINEWFVGIMPSHLNLSTQTYYKNIWSPFVQFPIMNIGIVLFFLNISISSRQVRYRYIVSYVLFGFSLYMLYGQTFGTNNILGISTYLLWGAWYGVLVFSQIIRENKIVDNPFFRAIGRYSYGIYLFQFIWLKFYDSYFTIEYFQVWSVKLINAIIALLLVSIILTRYYNKLAIKGMYFLIRTIGSRKLWDKRDTFAPD